MSLNKNLSLNKIIHCGSRNPRILKSPIFRKRSSKNISKRKTMFNKMGYPFSTLSLVNNKFNFLFSNSTSRNFSSSNSTLRFKGAYAGFKSYDEEFHVVPFDPNDLSSCVEGVNNFLNILESDKIYSVLAIINYIEDGRLLSKTVSRESLKMHKSSDADVIAKIIIEDLENAIFKYAIPENFDLYFRYRVWLDELSYKDKWIGIQRGVDEALSDKLLKVDGNEFLAIDRRLNSLNLGSFKLPGLNYGLKVFDTTTTSSEKFNLDFMKDYNLPIIEVCEPLLEVERFYDEIQNVEYYVTNINKTTFFVQCYYLNEIGGKTKGTSWFDISLIENPENISLDPDNKIILFKRYF